MVDAPPYPPAGKVSETDPCQVVYKEREGGFLILCKGKECSKGVKCEGTLQWRRKKAAPNAPWHDADDPEVYDKERDYRCCRGVAAPER